LDCGRRRSRRLEPREKAKENTFFRERKLIGDLMIIFIGDYKSISSPQKEVRKRMAFGKKNDNRVIKNLSPPSEKCNKGKERG
jgi:hypothetical protein